MLINGHRAGTANVSKLSIADVERIEIVRGPSSVVYGSQNMGGVINIILKTGRTAPGTLIEASAGSWSLFQGKAQSGGTSGKFDWYVGVEAGSRQDYNSSGQRHRAEHPLVALRRHRRLRHADRREPARRRDGPQRRHLRRGLPRLGANVFAFDNRYNQSAEIAYTGKTPDGRGSVFAQAYYVQRRRRSQQPQSRSARSTPSPRAPMSTATAASSTSWARASSRATSRGRATSCCSASTGSAARSAPTAIA